MDMKIILFLFLLWFLGSFITAIILTVMEKHEKVTIKNPAFRGIFMISCVWPPLLLIVILTIPFYIAITIGEIIKEKIRKK